MKILLLAPQPFYTPRGTPIAVRELIEALTGQGHRITLLTYHEGEDVEIPGCEVRRIPRWVGVRNVPPSFSLKKVWCDAVMSIQCLALVRRERFDLIHAVEEAAD